MPVYRFQLADGRIVRIEADQPPTEAEVMAMVGPAAPKNEAPPTPTTGPVQGASTPTTQVTTPGLPQKHTTLETILGTLNTIPKQIQQGVASGIDLAQGETTLAESMKKQWKALSPHSKVTGETPLEALGMGDGKLRSGLGIALDLVSPMGLPGKVARGLGATGRLAETLVNPIGAGVKGTVEAAKMIPGVKATGNTLAKPFVQYHGLDKFVGRGGITAQDQLHLHDSRILASENISKQKISKAMEKLDETDRNLVADFMADPVAFPLPAGKAHLATNAAALKRLFNEQAQKQVRAGFMAPTQILNDYFPQVRKSGKEARDLVIDNVNAQDRFTKTRSKTWQQHKNTGLAVDPAKAASVRLASGERAMQTAEMLTDMGSQFGRSAINAPPGYRPLDLTRVNIPEHQKGAMRSIAFPEEIASVLERAHTFEADPTGFDKIWKTANRVFKQTVTQYNPAYHANNMLGNLYLAYLGGMDAKNVASIYTARNLKEVNALMGTVKGGTPAQQAAVIAATRNQPLGNTGLTHGQAFEFAQKHNLFGSSEANIDYDRLIGKTSPHPVIAAFNKSTDAIRYWTSRHVEDTARWALFKDALLKGKTPEQAILHTKKHLFDYSQLTDAEKKLRDYGVVPFYAWMRKNGALHVGKLAEPELLRKANIVYQTPGRLFGPEGDVYMQDWQKEEGYQPVGRAKEDGSIPLMRLANPALDFNKLINPAAAAKSGLGPVPQMAIEAWTGRDLRTDAKLFGNPDRHAAASPLGSVAAQIEMNTGIPMPTFGTVPKLVDGQLRMVQPEVAAFIFNQIPMPLIPYAQKIASSPGETIGTEVSVPIYKRLRDTLFKAAGLTTRNLTGQQQLDVFKKLLQEVMEPHKENLTQQMGEAMMKGPKK